MAAAGRPVRLRRFAALWLICHLSMLTAALVVVNTAGDCVCPLGADASCPMHHKTSGAHTPCSMTSAAQTTVLPSLDGLLGAAGPMPDQIAVVFLASSVTVHAMRASDLVDQPFSPDPPPPRS
jgi:hypothetical protein